jgi:hypothetical protein
MKLSAVISVLLALTVAVDVGPIISQTPQCAYSCLEQAVASANCGTADFACQCNSANLGPITTKANLCLTANSTCGAQDISSASISFPSLAFESASIP